MVKLKAISACVPSREVLNIDFHSHFKPAKVTGVEKVVGVKSRRWATAEQTTIDLCVSAAKALPVDAALKDIDLLIVALQTPRKLLPAAAFEIHRKLNLSESCACLTLNAGCPAFADALALAFDLLKVRKLRRAVVIVGDTLSKRLDMDDRATSMIFGDAASAALIENDPKSDEKTKYVSAGGTSSEGLEAISLELESTEQPSILTMNGLNVFNFTINTIPRVMAKMSKNWSNQYGSIEKFDCYLIHQANDMITEKLREKLGLSGSEMPSNLALYGNTSGSTIPLLICTERANGKLIGGELVLLVGFGVGLAWSAVAFEMPDNLPTSIVEL